MAVHRSYAAETRKAAARVRPALIEGLRRADVDGRRHGGRRSRDEQQRDRRAGRQEKYEMFHLPAPLASKCSQRTRATAIAASLSAFDSKPGSLRLRTATWIHTGP